MLPLPSDVRPVIRHFMGIPKYSFGACIAAVLALGLLPLAPAAVEIVHVWPAHRTAESFQRLSEFFDGREHTGRETVVRTQAGARDGYYFLVRIRSDSAVAGTVFVLDVILPGRPEPKTFSFPADLPAGEHVFELGLTGSDWPDAKLRPAAWRVTVRGPAGANIAVLPSFLWRAPPPS